MAHLVSDTTSGWHAVLGDYEPKEGDSVQRACDQKLMTKPTVFAQGKPTCPKCKRMVEEKEKLMEEKRASDGVDEKAEGQAGTYFVPPPSSVTDEGELATFLRSLSTSVRSWSQANFGDNPSHRQVLGIFEEYVELQEGLDEVDREKVRDAIADITIYMADYYGKREWDFGEDAGDVLCCNLHSSSVLSAIGKIAHHQLKGEQGIRGAAEEHEDKLKYHCMSLLGHLRAQCDILNEPFALVVADIWNGKVAKRDWVENPEDAAAIVDAAGVVPERVQEEIEEDLGE